MQQIVKETEQIFEVFTSKKEFLNHINFKWLFDDEGLWQDEDSSLTLIYKDGTEISYIIGDKKQPLKQNDIIKAHYANPGSSMIYNCEIVYNERYEDYEVNI